MTFSGTKTLFLIVVSLFLFVSCVGKQQFDDAMKLEASGKKLEAITKLKEAVRLEPDNAEYRAALVRLQTEAIKKIHERAQAIVDAARPLSITTINEVKDHLNQAAAIHSDHPQVQAFAQKIKNEEDAIRKKASVFYANAETSMQLRDWYKAFLELQELQKIYPSYEESEKLLQKASVNAAQELFAEAKKLFDEEEYRDAIPRLRKVITIDPAHSQAQEMLQQANKRDNKGYFIDQGHKAVGEKRWNLALKRFRTALSYDKNDTRLQEFIEKAQTKAGLFYVNTAKSQLNEGWAFRAFESYQLALKNSPPGLNELELSNLRQDLVNRLKMAAEQFRSQERAGTAWFFFKRILELAPDDQMAMQAMNEMSDIISRRIIKSIAVFDFSSPADNRDAGIIVANNLITHLFKNAPRDIKILERENLKSILEEMKLGQIGIVSENTAKQMGRMFGIDIATMGSVLLYKVDSTTADGTKTVRYQVGTKIKDNIEYLNWRARYGGAPESSQFAPPAKIEVPEFAEKEYRVSHVKKIGFVNTSFRIVDVRTGENIQVRTLEKKKMVEDDASAGLAEAGVTFDPLEIPTDTELLQSLTSLVIEEMGREILTPLSRLEETYFKEGTRLLERRSRLSAAEQFVNVLFDEELKGTRSFQQNTIKNLQEIFRSYNDNRGM